MQGAKQYSPMYAHIISTVQRVPLLKLIKY